MDFWHQLVDLFWYAIDVFRHLDTHLLRLAHEYGIWTYAILALVVFCETGLVVTPFLPGDSLLFTVGALCATPLENGSGNGETVLSLAVALPILFIAAVVGDAVNFAIGARIGPRILEKERVPFIKKAHIEKTQRFYDKYGGKTIILARFVPIVRTFAPFVAGIGKMNYRRFFIFNVVGAAAWVLICAFAGFFFGRIPIVQKNFELVVLGIIFISVLPVLVEVWRSWRASRASPNAGTG